MKLCENILNYFKEHFGKVIPSADNKFSALNSAVWSVDLLFTSQKEFHVKRPLQAYFRINAEKWVSLSEL